MDRQTKLKYQKDVQTYLEKNNVYDLFEELMKKLVIQQPNDPIDYLINQLNQPDIKRVFIVGPPGSKVKEYALQIADKFQMNTINTGQLLKKEISKQSERGETIQRACQKGEYVRDDIVIDIVKKAIQEQEKQGDKGQAYVLQGFPKTRVQALALQKAGIIPNSFLILTHQDDQLIDLLKFKLTNSEGFYSSIPLSKKDQLAAQMKLEYLHNLSQVQQAHDQFYFQLDGEQRPDQILEDIGQLLKFKINNKTPRQSARIVILGPPGSGRSTLGKNLASAYGFVFISTTELISNEIAQQTEVGRACMDLVARGELVKEDIIKGLVMDRLQQTDCLMQGFVIDGFPKTNQQLQELSQLQINPTYVFILECHDEIVYQRFSQKKVDPITGIVYDKLNIPNNRDIEQRLQNNPNQTRDIVEQRLKRWKNLLQSVEEQYSSIIVQVNANASPQNILEKASSFLVNSNPGKKGK